MVGTTQLASLLLLLSAAALVSCGPANGLPTIDESGNEVASVIDEPAGEIDQPSTAKPTKKLLLSQAMNLRYEKSGILEAKTELPVGTQIEIPENYDTKNLDYRNSDGSIDRSSTGFIFPVKVIAVDSVYASQFPKSKIDEINKTSGGLFISASIVGTLEGAEGSFAVIPAPTTLGAGFTKYYAASGKPKFSYVNSITKRFGAKLNMGIVTTAQSSAERAKYQAIYQELAKAVNRKAVTPKSYLMMAQTPATQASINFEKTGVINPMGAWTIATMATAVRHGFENVPCAEFQSELLRQAYQRAGYRVTDDFNTAKGNPLIWTNSAAVVNFSMGLYKAGWVAWDSTKYRPIVGSFLMNGSGLSPGHTYISAGDDGMIIVDNGAPQGRDLRKASENTISIMFQTGVFFLPPGVNPPVW